MIVSGDGISNPREVQAKCKRLFRELCNVPFSRALCSRKEMMKVVLFSPMGCY